MRSVFKKLVIAAVTGALVVGLAVSHSTPSMKSREWSAPISQLR